jgi:hypothetical protein
MANPFKRHPRVKNTDGRTPTTTLSAGKNGEGNTTMRVTGKGVIGAQGTNAAIDKMIDRNAAAFHKDVAKRNGRIKQPRRSGSCD